MLLLAPEEPAWDLGGGVSFVLYPGVAMLVLALLTVVVAVVGCLSISCDSKTGLYCVSCLYTHIVRHLTVNVCMLKTSRRVTEVCLFYMMLECIC